MVYLIPGTEVQYSIKRYARAKQVRIQIDRTGDIVVTAPKRLAIKKIQAFVTQKADWILTERNEQRAGKSIDLISNDREHFLKHRDTALELAQQKVTKWNQHYQFEYQSVRVKQLKSRWGSCSSKGNLNFSYRILFLPEYLQDYLVVHELCHLQEMNHSTAFWALVGETIPEYSDCIQAFKQV